MALLSAVPAMTVLFVWTNEYHHLIWQSFNVIHTDVDIIKVTHGPWFVLHTVYSYFLVGASAIYALYRYFRYRLQRSRVKAIIIAPIVAVSMNVVYLTGASGFNQVDLTPLGFSFALFVFSWAIFKENLLQLVPIARSVLFEKMDDAIVVVEKNFRVIDINISAVKLFDVVEKQVIGTPFLQVISQNKTLETIIDNTCSEVKVGEKSFQALKTILSLDGDNTSGYLIVFRDISELKKTQNELHDAREQLKEANRVLQFDANTDVLTTLNNRRFFFETLSHEIQRANRHNASLCLLMMDLDHFKQVNDTYGHPEGDRVLKRVANTMLSTVREIDFCGRVGGEEFAMVLVDTDIDGALTFAERLRELIETSHQENDIAITASIGLVINEAEDTMETLFEKADKALYTSKDLGRNRISMA